MEILESLKSGLLTAFKTASVCLKKLRPNPEEIKMENLLTLISDLNRDAEKNSLPITVTATERGNYVRVNVLVERDILNLGLSSRVIALNIHMTPDDEFENDLNKLEAAYVREAKRIRSSRSQMNIIQEAQPF
jgi:hypothetical protein